MSPSRPKLVDAPPLTNHPLVDGRKTETSVALSQLKSAGGTGWAGGGAGRGYCASVYPSRPSEVLPSQPGSSLTKWSTLSAHRYTASTGTPGGAASYM